MEEVENLETKININFDCAIVIGNDTISPFTRNIDDWIDPNEYKSAGLANPPNGKRLIVINSNALFLRKFKNENLHQSNGGLLTHELGHAIASLSDTLGEQCKMSKASLPFCQSCQDALRQVLLPHLAKMTVKLLTKSVSFNNTTEGITTYRPIVFEVTSAKEVNLKMTQPTGGFGTPKGLTKKVSPSNGFQPIKERLWISYTATSAGASISGKVTVSCPETGLSEEVPIYADTIARPKSAAVLVLDRTGSMDELAGDGIAKIKKLREASITFIDLMQKGDGIGIVRYNEVSDPIADVLMNVKDIDAQHDGMVRTEAKDKINNNTTPDGTTSIGAGIINGMKVLNAPSVTSTAYDVRAIVVLTDGCENTSPFLSESVVKSSINARTFAVGLGLPENIDTAALSKLTQGSGGYLLITGNITQEQTYLLTKYFLQILANVDNKHIIVDPTGYLAKGEEHRIPFQVTEADIDLNVILLTYYPWLVNFRIETPGGKILDPATAEFIEKETMSFYRLNLPATPEDIQGSHVGTWHALLSIKDQGQIKSANVGEFKIAPKEMASFAVAPMTGLPYDLTVQCYSNLNFYTKIQQNGFEPGDEVSLHASLKEYDVPLAGSATVWAEIKLPDGNDTSITMNEVEAGRFEGKLVTTISGLYSLQIRAAGLTSKGGSFTREQTHSAAVYQGGDNLEIVNAIDRQRDRCGCLARLLDCLFCGKTYKLKLCWIWRFLLVLIVMLVLIILLMLAFRLATQMFH